MGWVNSFIAHECEKGKSDESKSIDSSEEVGAADTERQDVVSLTIDEVKQNVQEGNFLEVQWSNTVALAMLKLV